MQWKIPFKEYFQSEDSKIKSVSEEYSLNVDQLLVNTGPKLDTNRLSKEQLVVINKFPTVYDNGDKNWAKYTDLVNDWKNSKREIWPLAYNMHAYGGLNVMSAFYICNRFRHAFGLANGRTAVLNSYVPALLLPLFFGPIIHYKLITANLLTGQEGCQLCRCMNAGLIQGITSTIYPMVYGSVSSIYFADYFNTYPTPSTINDSVSRKYIYDILWKSFKNNKIGFATIGVFNFMFAFYLTQSEHKTIEFMYFSLLRQEYEKNRQKF